MKFSVWCRSFIDGKWIKLVEFKSKKECEQYIKDWSKESGFQSGIPQTKIVKERFECQQ